MSAAAAVETSGRMSSEERRASIIRAAIAVFGANGYAGTTTDEVARAASVSQPYVVRLFGSKEKLFVAAISDALATLLSRFRAVIAEHPGDLVAAKEGMGRAYVELLGRRGLHMILSHAFLLGGEPGIGEAARGGWGEVWTFLRDEAGFTADEARAFLAEGMLINTMVGLRLIDDYGTTPVATELFDTCFPTDFATVAKVVPRAAEDW